MAQLNPNEYGTWQMDGRQLRVEYSLQVFEELRLAADDGFQKLLRGGLEIGVVLLGTHNQDSVRVEEWRMIECRHAQGPGFLLDDQDLVELDALLKECASSAQLAGLEPVGWLHTHTRSDLLLSPEDIEIHERFFPQPWQIAMIMRVRRDEAALAGVFFRGEDGRMKAETVGKAFPIVPNPVMMLRPSRATAAMPKAAERVTPPPPRPERIRTELPQRKYRKMGFNPSDSIAAAKEVSPGPVTELPAAVERRVPSAYDRFPSAMATVEKPKTSRLWLKLLVAMLVLMVLAAAAVSRPYWQGVQEKDLALRAEEHGLGQMVIQWDHSAPLARRASRGVLDIVEGAGKTEIALTKADVQGGSVTYLRQGSQVRLSLWLQDGSVMKETTFNFRGEPVASRSKPLSPEELDAQVKGDMERLTEQLRQQKEHGKQLNIAIGGMDRRLKQGK